jgi:hypothetical protein
LIPSSGIFGMIGANRRAVSTGFLVSNSSPTIHKKWGQVECNKFRGQGQNRGQWSIAHSAKVGDGGPPGGFVRTRAPPQLPLIADRLTTKNAKKRGTVKCREIDPVSPSFPSPAITTPSIRAAGLPTFDLTPVLILTPPINSKEKSLIGTFDLSLEVEQVEPWVTTADI